MVERVGAPHLWTDDELDYLVKSSVRREKISDFNKLRRRIQTNTRLSNSLAIDMAIGRVCDVDNGQVSLRPESFKIPET